MGWFLNAFEVFDQISLKMNFIYSFEMLVSLSLLVEIAGILISCLQPHTSGFLPPVLFLHHACSMEIFLNIFFVFVIALEKLHHPP